MNVKKLIGSLDFSPSENEMNLIKSESEKAFDLIESALKKNKIDADVFIGGSFAKNTLVDSDKYDIDFFIRFDWTYDNLSDKLGKVLKSAFRWKGFKIKKVHGSRDYFRVFKNKKIIFEVIPVIRIKKVGEERNVTDLSYFHVLYVKKKLVKNPKLAREILLAKKFFRAQGVYGAESYIGGFSGYGLECLVIHYGSFLKLVKALIKIKDREIIDSEKQYKKKQDILFSMNESKLDSPIILVDPTWKERNVLAALTREKFNEIQEAIRGFLKNPNKTYFEERKFDEKKLINFAKENNAEIVKLKLKTNRQEGDIAGTKMKKFSRFILSEIKEYFEIIKAEFVYSSGKNADYYLIVRPKKEILRIGPPVSNEKASEEFKKSHENVFIKNGYFHVKLPSEINGKNFIEKWKKKNKKVIREMGITKINLG